MATCECGAELQRIRERYFSRQLTVVAFYCQDCDSHGKRIEGAQNTGTRRKGCLVEPSDEAKAQGA